jgi:hypothetical protein
MTRIQGNRSKRHSGKPKRKKYRFSLSSRPRSGNVSIVVVDPNGVKVEPKFDDVDLEGIEPLELATNLQ